MRHYGKRHVTKAHVNHEVPLKPEECGKLPDIPATSNSGNVSTCSFFTRKRRCARGFQILSHTSGGRFRKCGETKISQADPCFTLPRPAVLLTKSGCARRFPISPHLRNARPRKACSSNKGGIRDNSSSSANVKGPLPETEQRPFFVSASRRVHGDCITENILQRHQAPGIPGDVPLFRKLIPNLEAIQLAIWQIPIFCKRPTTIPGAIPISLAKDATELRVLLPAAN